MGAAFCILLIIYKPQFTWPGFIIVLLVFLCIILLFHERKKSNKYSTGMISWI